MLIGRFLWEFINNISEIRLCISMDLPFHLGSLALPREEFVPVEVDGIRRRYYSHGYRSLLRKTDAASIIPNTDVMADLSENILEKHSYPRSRAARTS